jgi:uncharacterized protein YuzE
MKLSYDPRYNLAYIHFKDKGNIVETIKISEELYIDIAPDGTIYGFELLNANEQLKSGSIEVLNEENGKKVDLKLEGFPV